MFVVWTGQYNERQGDRYTDYDLGQGYKRLSLKSHMVNISGFAHQIVSVTATQLCYCSQKAAVDKTYTNELGVPIKWYLWTQ